MTPDFQIIAGGADITAQIRDRLISLSITDEAGLKSDQVEITLDDRDNLIELPAPGALLIVFMGYKETFLVPMGIYTVDEICAKGPPDTITIRGKAADLGGSVKEQKTRGWDDMTIGSIVKTIAGEHGLKAKVAGEYSGIFYKRLDQTAENDLNFLIRLARDHDALATVKGRTLLFIVRGAGQTASGKPMLPVPIRKTGRLNWSLTLALRDDFQSVEANWRNEATGQKEKVSAGSGTPVRKLRHCYADEDEARRACKARLDECERSKDTLAITMPGNPLIAAEAHILAPGFRSGANGIWSVTSARHEITTGGFTTAIDTEKPGAAAGSQAGETAA